MDSNFQRLVLGIQEKKFKKIQDSRIAIIGIGGVGSYVLEAISRCGVNNILIIDRDVVDRTNINRQLIALENTIGLAKVDVAEERVLLINPECKIEKHQIFMDENTINILFDFNPDYVVDCIDTITSKILLIKKCLEKNIPIISSMGTANKFHPEMLKISDLSKTTVDPIARIIRSKLKKDGFYQNLKVVFSEEQPIEQKIKENDSQIRKESMPLSSNSFVPGTAGLLLASYVINQILEVK